MNSPSNAISDEAELLLTQLWPLRLKELDQPSTRNTVHRPFQSNISQDEQQRIIHSLVPSSCLAMNEEALQRLRSISVCSLKDHSKNNMLWAMRADLMHRARGDLPLSIKVVIDCTKASGKRVRSFSQASSHKQLDPSLVVIQPLHCTDQGLLQEVIREVNRTGMSRSVLVLSYLILGRTTWPHQEYDTHISRQSFI
jgi:hypothetical protein